MASRLLLTVLIEKKKINYYYNNPKLRHEGSCVSDTKITSVCILCSVVQFMVVFLGRCQLPEPSY